MKDDAEVNILWVTKSIFTFMKLIVVFGKTVSIKFLINQFKIGRLKPNIA